MANTQTITWTNKSGAVRIGTIVGRGFYHVDRGEEYEVEPVDSKTVRVFVPVECGL